MPVPSSGKESAGTVTADVQLGPSGRTRSSSCCLHRGSDESPKLGTSYSSYLTPLYIYIYILYIYIYMYSAFQGVQKQLGQFKCPILMLIPSRGATKTGPWRHAFAPGHPRKTPRLVTDSCFCSASTCACAPLSSSRCACARLSSARALSASSTPQAREMCSSCCLGVVRYIFRGKENGEVGCHGRPKDLRLKEK